MTNLWPGWQWPFPALCKANGAGKGANFNRPHVAVQGMYDGKERMSCLYCGVWLEGEDGSSELQNARQDV